MPNCAVKFNAHSIADEIAYKKRMNRNNYLNMQV
jgi:hypothetical protein